MRARAAAAVLLVVALVRPAAALPLPAQALTIVGTGNTYVTIAVAAETRYYLDQATAQFLGGRWGGFLIGPDSSRPDDGRRDSLTLWTVYDQPTSAGRQDFAVFSGRPARPAPHESKTGVLAPGRYRVYLFTDGQEVTVTLPWTAPSRRVEPEKPFRARIESRRVVAPGGGTPTLLAMPLDATRRSVVEAAAVYDHGGQYTALPGVTRADWACFAYTTQPVRQQACDRGDRSAGFTARRWELGGSRVERRYGSTSGMQWRAFASPDTTAVLTALTVRYDP